MLSFLLWSYYIKKHPECLYILSKYQVLRTFWTLISDTACFMKTSPVKNSNSYTFHANSTILINAITLLTFFDPLRFKLKPMPCMIAKVAY
jgi:hypothetical protein